MKHFTITSTSGSDLRFMQIIKFPGPMKQLTIPRWRSKTNVFFLNKLVEPNRWNRFFEEIEPVEPNPLFNNRLWTETVHYEPEIGT